MAVADWTIFQARQAILHPAPGRSLSCHLQLTKETQLFKFNKMALSEEVLQTIAYAQAHGYDDLLKGGL